ncbi:hypothetical protein [Hymenobacter cellulosilyticus]|uniref:Uncharacterized protein n=1 Tax=Hymenobacter cellulosilyticus TaxID=2932248 RepID=A0A8T9QAG2_9BACT|nr:hypothetical protein [Hymenobacter cellulosilyticus]UOQ72800.1 hypothetical protein MUN79_02055 [Hymenobacter cellulosilyticus]
MENSPVDTNRGLFQAIDSFAIRRRNEFYIIGQLIEGEVQEQWYVQIPFNRSTSLSLRVTQLETIDITGSAESYQLLIVAADAEAMDLLLALRVGSERIVISSAGPE